MEEVEILDIGDKVKHPKFGQGTVMQRSGDSENQKVIVKFGGDVGEKKLVTRMANMKKIQDRPTLAAPVEGGVLPTSVQPREKAIKPEVEEEDEDIELVIDDDDDELEDEADDEEAEAEAEEEEE